MSEQSSLPQRRNQAGLKLRSIRPRLTFFVTSRCWLLLAPRLMVASVAALTASRLTFGRFLAVPLVTAVLVLLFGGLTLWLDDPRFIKIKPTAINLLFAAVLLAGLWMRRPLLKLLLGEAFNLTEEGWRLLTMRWIAFFIALAGINELVWRNFSDAVWVNFKFFGILFLTIAFAMAQVGLIKRHEIKPAVE